ncbi:MULTISPECIES: FAD-dependent oxidoreductase [unclassified Frankia]|uniref:FAD-dependent oxidoreductase n=1 Tax=unclassified Frankia TaxID=2632575 RepID=UPI0020247494
MGKALRVAVVGAGPAGLYTADALLFQRDVPVEVDVFDRLPTPFGLLRYGVAPDHLKMKSLTKVLQRTLDDDRVRFFGSVVIGKDLTVEELRARYHAVVYAFGASTDRRLGVPGEALPGSASATHFVHWYSGHPDVPADTFRLDAEAVAVVGVGNVAIDVTRMLLKDAGALRRTDIPDPVLDVLAASKVREVHLLGRRGPAHASFTSKELRELGNLEGVDVVVDPAQLELDDVTAARCADNPDVQRNLTILREWSGRPRSAAARSLHIRFWTRPVELRGEGALQAVVLEETTLSGAGAVVSTGRCAEIPVQLLLRSIGYRGVAVSGVPFDEERGTVPSVDGRVSRDGASPPGEYVAGWIGRGPVGVLGTNKSDAEVVVQRLLSDAAFLTAGSSQLSDVTTLLRGRKVAFVDCSGWGAIDAAEIARGAERERPRAKIATWAELLVAAHSADVV